MAVLALCFGADAPENYKGFGWTRALWTQAMRGDSGGTLPAFRYYAVSPPYTENVATANGQKLRLRCRMYGGAQAVHIVCTMPGGPKA